MKPTILLTAAAALTLGTLHAADEVVSVGERIRRENAPMGVRWGGVIVTPKVDVEATYNDNIYATRNNEKSDIITTVRPEVRVQSGWSRHAFNVLANVETNKYLDKDSENNDNYTVAMDGRVDVAAGTAIGGGISHARTHEDRGSPNSVASAVEPTEVNTTLAKIGAYRELGRVTLRADADATKKDYDNGRTSAGAVVDNNLRDRNEYQAAVRVGYKTTDVTEVYVRGLVDSRVYDYKGNAVNPLRSNHGQTGVVGVTWGVTGKTKVDAYAGVAQRDYVNKALKDINEPTFGLRATWNASDLTTLMASVDRGIEETTSGSSSGYVRTSYDVGAEHALMRNFVLNGGLGYSTNNYKGNVGTQRDDDIVLANVGAKYYFTPNFNAGVGYEFRTRDSNINGLDYDRNAVMLRLTGTY